MTKTIRFQAISRPTIYMDVAGKIRDAILDGTMAAGNQLPPERELAGQFGVSRATVREALRHLQAQGLLSARGRTSPLETASPDAAAVRFREALTHVVQLQRVPLGDLVELRVAVEVAALIRAAASPVPEAIEEARAALALMERPDVRSEKFQEADVAFHVALVTASGNQAFQLVMLAVRDAVRLHLGAALDARSFAKVRPRIVEEHRSLLRAVENGSGQAAAAQLRRHLNGFYGT